MENWNWRRHGIGKASFEPKIVAKGQSRFTGFDDKIISMYARGMSTREIQGHLEEIYGIEVSPTLISNVTEAIVEEVKAWQSRPLEELYPIVYLDAMMVKMRDNGHVQNQAVYVVLGVDREGQKDVLGLWVAEQEGAKFWLQVLTELKNRGVKDIFIACVDGLKGFPEAIEALYPQTEVQLCIVHLVRASLNYVPWKYRKLVAADLRADLSIGYGGRSPTAPGGDDAEVDGLSQRRPGVATELGSHHTLFSTIRPTYAKRFTPPIV